jgi:hypothetical protein
MMTLPLLLPNVEDNVNRSACFATSTVLNAYL